MTLTMTQTKRTVIASTGMHKFAFVNARKIAEGLGGCVTTTDDGNFKAVFKSNKVATEFVTAWNAHYEQAQVNKKPKDEPKPKKVATGKGKKKATPRKRKPTTAKGNANAEIAEWVKANDLCTLTEAQAHGFTGKTRNDLWNFKVDLGLRKGKR